jgi:hypothetical protein
MMAGEIDALVEALETQRAGILKTLSGISQANARRSTVAEGRPSGQSGSASPPPGSESSVFAWRSAQSSA